MLQIAIVVFREVLEIALILGILASSTKEIKGRSNYILAGLFLGIAISIALAFFRIREYNQIERIFSNILFLFLSRIVSVPIMYGLLVIAQYVSKIIMVGSIQPATKWIPFFFLNIYLKSILK